MNTQEYTSDRIRRIQSAQNTVKYVCIVGIHENTTTIFGGEYTRIWGETPLLPDGVGQAGAHARAAGGLAASAGGAAATERAQGSLVSPWARGHLPDGPRRRRRPLN